MIGCGLALVAFLAMIAAIAENTDRNDAPPSATVTSQPSMAATATASSNDYASGYARGQSEGIDHAKSGAGMPIPLGMNWMADMQLQRATPADAETWKRGFKDGFEAGFKSVTAFHRDESEWEQLSWQNARPGVRLYDYGGKHEATIRTTDRSAGLIVVRYQSGEVEPKDLNAVAAYWWVRKSKQ